MVGSTKAPALSTLPPLVLLQGFPWGSKMPLICISDKRPDPAPEEKVSGTSLNLTGRCSRGQGRLMLPCLKKRHAVLSAGQIITRWISHLHDVLAAL